MFAVIAVFRISESRMRFLTIFANLGRSMAETTAMAKVRASVDEVLKPVVIRPEALMRAQDVA